MNERTVKTVRVGSKSSRVSEEVPDRSRRPPRGRLPETRPGSKRPSRRLPPEVLTDAEVCGLMRACGRHAPTGLRNRALIALLYRAGLRINEALSLYPKDLELADGSVRVLRGKGGRSRTVGLDAGAAAIIERWLDTRSRCLTLALLECRDETPSKTRSPKDSEPRASARAELRRTVLRTGSRMKSPCGTSSDPVVSGGTFGRHPVFCTLSGRPMAAAYVRVMLKRLAARAGIDIRQRYAA